MALAGWNVDNKYKITIDNSKIDSGLVDFPVAIVISSGTGTNNLDATNIFDTLGSDANRTKIAVTDVNDNQLYTEIEDWDTTNERACLWVKVSTVSDSADTIIYLYYDATQSGNGSYVGDTGDIPAQNVWDGDFELIYHLAQDPSVGAAGDIKDSTSNALHGQPFNFESIDLVDAPVGKAIDFDGSTEYMSVPDNDALSFGDAADDVAFTLEVFVNMDDADKFRMLEKRIPGGGGDFEYIMVNAAVEYFFGNIYDVPGTADRRGRRTADGTEASYEGIWTHYGFVYRGTELETGIDLTRDGVNVDTQTNSVGGYTAMHNLGATSKFYIGTERGGTPSQADGRFSEVRVSRTDRSNAWLKATAYTLNDNLLSFEFLGPVFTFSNVVPVHLSTVYGTTQQLSITTVISGGLADYVYDAVFYDGNTDIQIGSTAGISSGSPASMSLDTPSGINYYWYIQASSSGVTDTSSTYSFTNRFLCAGDVYVNAGPASGIPIRLYRRSTGEFIGQTTSTGVVATFEVESTYNEDHYAIALYSDDTTNALIYDWISPE